MSVHVFGVDPATVDDEKSVLYRRIAELHAELQVAKSAASVARASLPPRRCPHCRRRIER